MNDLFTKGDWILLGVTSGFLLAVFCLGSGKPAIAASTHFVKGAIRMLLIGAKIDIMKSVLFTAAGLLLGFILGAFVHPYSLERIGNVTVIRINHVTGSSYALEHGQWVHIEEAPAHK